MKQLLDKELGAPPTMSGPQELERLEAGDLLEESPVHDDLMNPGGVVHTGTRPELRTILVASSRVKNDHVEGPLRFPGDPLTRHCHHLVVD